SLITTWRGNVCNIICHSLVKSKVVDVWIRVIITIVAVNDVGIYIIVTGVTLILTAASSSFPTCIYTPISIFLISIIYPTAEINSLGWRLTIRDRRSRE